MERGLSIEDDIIVIAQMALDSVADLQVLIRSILQDGEIDVATVDSLDVLCSRPVICSPVDQRSQFLLVMLRDYFGHGQVHGDLEWYTELI